MKRDLPPTVPLHVSRPAASGPLTPVKRRAGRHQLHAAMVLLIPRELTREQLAEKLQTRYPHEPVYLDDIVARLAAQDFVLEADGHIGLTDDGADTAARLKREEVLQQATRAAVLSPPEDPVAQGVDKTLLTRSPVRPSSAADNAVPCMRTGGDDHERFPSRYGNQLRYRDGRVTDMAGNAL